MLGTPNYKMPASIWMVPGGNRDQKRSLMKAQKYPMMSAIQKNLGGPLSEVFFSFLTPEQHDFIGYAPKLKGPGQDLWVAPSDILQNHVVMTRPHTSGLKQAMTHYGIMKLGKEVEDKVLDYYETEMKQFLKEMEKMLRAEFKVKVEEAVNEDRRYQNELRGKYIQEATTDLNKTFQKILSDTVVELLEESVQKLQEEVDCTKREMEEELCQAVNHRGDHLSRQFEFQLAWRENELFTKYQDSLRKLQHTFEERLDKVNTQRLNQMKAKEAEMAANHVTDLIIQAAERAKINHQERLELEHDFEDWFIKYIDDEVIKREYTIIDRENEIRSLKAKCERWEYQMREVFKHFQRFINFALKEQPGQAEFMLSIEKELQDLTKAKSTEGDVELIAQTIIEFLIKTVAEKRQQETAFDLDEKLPETSLDGVCYKMQKKGLAQRVLKLEGKKNISTLNETRFKQIEKKSLVGMFRKNRSMVPMLASKNF